jgi:cytochrome c
MCRNLLLLLLTTVSLFSCGETKTEEKINLAPNVYENPVYQEGLALVAKSNCLSCHQINEQATGPAYSAIAAKYTDSPETIDQLSNKIINGGAGVWGQVAMNPHPNVTKADAEKMVKYILLLKQ